MPTDKDVLLGGIQVSTATYQQAIKEDVIVVAEDSSGRGTPSLTARGNRDRAPAEGSSHGMNTAGEGVEDFEPSTLEEPANHDRHHHHHRENIENTHQEEASPRFAVTPYAPRVPSVSPPTSQGPRHYSSLSTRQIPQQARNGRVGEDSDGSFSAASSGSSSGSSSASSGLHSYDSDEDGGVMEDFTAGIGSWLEDVHGAGREAFFGLFKRDVTPQFSRPALDLLGRRVSTFITLWLVCVQREGKNSRKPIATDVGDVSLKLVRARYLTCTRPTVVAPQLNLPASFTVFVPRM